MVLPDLKSHFQEKGYCLSPPLIPQDLLDRVVPRMDAVIGGEYETGVPPYALHFTPEDPPGKLRKIDQPHLCDRTIQEVVCHPALGEFAAGLLDAEWVQVWAVQLLVKPGGGDPAGRVGWHQDKNYWRYWKGEVFTCWVAVSDVTADSGPMRYVPGSNHWGYLEGGNFYGGDDDLQRGKITLPEGVEWKEEPAILPPGAAAFHHKHTFHASGPNTSVQPRRSFAIHMRTHRSEPNPVEGELHYYISNLEDPIECPVIYGQR
jgi:hypothetical protein